MVTKQPRKARKARYNMPLHQRRKQLTVTLAKTLRATHKTRNLPIRKGDKVKIIKGKHKKKEGKITGVDYTNYLVFIEGITIKKRNGKEIQLGISPANLVITELDLTDKKRMK